MAVLLAPVQASVLRREAGDDGDDDDDDFSDDDDGDDNDIKGIIN